MKLTLESITYQDIIDGKVISGDKYGLYERTMSECRRNVLLSNPNLTDLSCSIIDISRADGIIIGESCPFPTKIKAGDVTINSYAGTTLTVEKEYRNTAAAVDVLMAPRRDDRYDAFVAADFSQDGLNCQKALRSTIFKLPKRIQPHNCKFIFENFGFKGFPLRVLTSLANMFVKPYVFFSNLIAYKTVKKYTVTKVDKVPEWIDDIVLNDGHKYMEVHDHVWMQWCLDHSFRKLNNPENYFYTIAQNGRNVGFVFIKERKHSIPIRNITDTKFGSIAEWGTLDENLLSESDIIKISTTLFSRDCDAIQFVSDNQVVLKSMKKFLFLPHAYHYVAVKDMRKKYKDFTDMNLWRLRFGYADSIFN